MPPTLKNNTQVKVVNSKLRKSQWGF